MLLGDHVPLIPLLEILGNIGATAPLQILVGKLKVGVIEFTVVTHD
jgi:hypothetical protein